MLSTGDNRGAQKSLLINGLLRFPLVITYCSIGLLLIIFIDKDPAFFQKVNALQKPDELMPVFFIEHIPAGLLGLIVAGIFAASMSSIDSAINSLSAATWEDILLKMFPALKDISDRKKVASSKLITVFWGIFTTGAAILLFWSSGKDTVIELVNKIGSAFYGPIAAVFVLAIIAKWTGQVSAILGLISGTLINIILWKGFPQVSWLWWNLVGFTVTMATALIIALLINKRKESTIHPELRSFKDEIKKAPYNFILILMVWFIIIISVCAALEYLL